MIEQHPSPNHSTRGANRVSILVLHATASEWPSAFAWLRNPASKVSAHYLVGRTGRTSQLVQENRTAWHAGVSQWRDREVWGTTAGARVPSVNPVSIGLELINKNNGSDPYPDAQYQAVLSLSRAIVARHRIERVNVVRHLDIAPGRKSDPAGFDWWRFLDDLFTPVGTLYRARDTAWIRQAPHTQSARQGSIAKGGTARGSLVLGEYVTQRGVSSEDWVQLATGGYVWSPQLEAL